ncbi:MAG: hypothetical protein COT28_18365 [Methylobacterium sp. CG08_land_8_20_14_0_20_71_15]|nr:MAG: hypothetical protein COT56_11255 [Methylobacterium sp. CG09_land_8_20_14_0_10_71_15]PIU11735.1 MAG: hypothetical protein COT28_18365 [Methylobacterium sp. CG08_land_8_20_14_0_20_71_15]
MPRTKRSTRPEPEPGFRIVRLLPLALVGLLRVTGLPIVLLGYLGARDNTGRLLLLPAREVGFIGSGEASVTLRQSSHLGRAASRSLRMSCSLAGRRSSQQSA